MKNLTVLLREVAAHKGFRYVEVRRNAMAEDVLEVAVEPRKGSRGRCGKCGRPGATYDHQSERMWRFVPLWVRQLPTTRAFLLVEGFQHFWTYVSPPWAGKFLDAWCRRIRQLPDAAAWSPTRKLPAVYATTAPFS